MRQMKTRKKFAHVRPELTKEAADKWVKERFEHGTQRRKGEGGNSSCTARKNDPFQKVPREETDAPPLLEISTFSQVF